MDMASLMAQMQGGQGKQLDTIIIMSLYMCLPFAISLKAVEAVWAVALVEWTWHH
jgi:hypothetical protein